LTAADAKGRGGGGGSSVLFLCVLCLHVGLAESFSYDFDGNLSQDDGFDYTWDGENRLKTATPRNPDNGDEKVAFVYDYMGRRVRKAVYVYNSGWPAEESPNKVEHFVYDHWNVVLVLNGLDGEDPGTEPDNALVRRYTWGLDLSGLSGDGFERGLHGAGGIGGLLAVEETEGTFQGAYWFFYDGNGNVGQVIKAGDQSVAARYEYDPYGNIIGPDDDADGDWQEHATAFALANPIRFSTKWFDTETGLGYWGYRYYSPRLGRWTSRDPIGELGALNLLAWCLNNGVDLVDLLGLQARPQVPGNWPEPLRREVQGFVDAIENIFNTALGAARTVGCCAAKSTIAALAGVEGAVKALSGVLAGLSSVPSWCVPASCPMTIPIPNRGVVTIDPCAIVNTVGPMGGQLDSLLDDLDDWIDDLQDRLEKACDD